MDQGAKRPKTALLQVRLTAEEHDAFKGFCAQVNLSPSEVMRRFVRQAVFMGPTFEGDARAEIVALTRQLRALGTNLNQAVRHMNAGHVIGSDDVAEWLATARGLIMELTALYRSLCARSQERAARAISRTAE
ncbi:plasmid mobilization protein [Methylocystis iwaonis]|uniref:Plasmid mobilization relaxosome protein MobC n=1 Tax=Methylocystis iwaonis TaxID=2885079 RepID=A0ABM8EE91_9HYPH|nr:plasmid mobilization relaxosome protein MobC [Methylocystis iwaonis]BDV36348.1 hypothetical protein SS37A_38780 [Methylocystis iwaonis]